MALINKFIQKQISKIENRNIDLESNRLGRIYKNTLKRYIDYQEMQENMTEEDKKKEKLNNKKENKKLIFNVLILLVLVIFMIIRVIYINK